jgi:Rrf2 family iron-sulfur cluster assembly transcriptional regulator
VREGILRGVRGPRGGYELARDEKEIGADEILRAAGTVEDHNDAPLTDSTLLANIVVPALERAEEKFSEALSRITVADLARSADKGHKSEE